ncbi:MAG: TetR/AcrR family transcriptional regulator [Oscillospiraceae bacterium]|nr:TetR/AcrR family transcriptional regulator [Oscillospiraceae bacterium]
MKKSERTKSIIISSVIELIEEIGTTDITMSMIAKKADVAVGLINYHYESKQALIIDAVRYYVSEHIAKENVFVTYENMSPWETLKKSFTSYADFLAEHALLSRLHIKFSIDGEIDADAAQQAVSYYLPIIKKVNNSLSDEQMMTALRMISSTIQMSFLQADMSSETFDFFDKEQRDKFIEQMIMLVIGEKGGNK